MKTTTLVSSDHFTNISPIYFNQSQRSNMLVRLERLRQMALDALQNDPIIKNQMKQSETTLRRSENPINPKLPC
ncbi:MAG: hypothetical protein AAFZ15_17000 [Bacteroidota bacterium]